MTEVSNEIEVSVVADYIAEESDPDRSYFFFAYKVKILNVGSDTAQLLNRHWIIVDEKGQTREVKGEGVVGQQPVIGPGEVFEYSSYCPLPTPQGRMRGRYELERSDGSRFVAEIAEFTLAETGAFRTLH